VEWYFGVLLPQADSAPKNIKNYLKRQSDNIKIPVPGRRAMARENEMSNIKFCYNSLVTFYADDMSQF
jgi:hypothetical protein